MKILIIIMSIFSSVASMALDFSNPYIGKNIDTHTKEFLAFEIVSNFHKSIDEYNKFRGTLPEAKLVNGHYEISEGKNIIEFNISFASTGNFYFNKVLKNFKQLEQEPKNKSSFKNYFDFFISTANAGFFSDDPVQLSTVLVAALISIDQRVKKSNSTGDNRQYLLQKLKEVYKECNENDRSENMDPRVVLQMKNFLKVVNSQQSKEQSIVEKTLTGIEPPNCKNELKQNMVISVPTQRANQLMDDGFEPNASVARNKYADQYLCAQLAELKSCLANKNTSIANANDTSRNYLNGVGGKVQDDIQNYYKTKDANDRYNGAVAK